MSTPLPDFPVDQVLSPALVEIMHELMRERARSVMVFGHDAAADDALPLNSIGQKATYFLQIATERAEGPDERRILPAARKKAVQGNIVAVAFIDAIDRELAREAEAGF